MVKVKNLKDIPSSLSKELNGLNETFPLYLQDLKKDSHPLNQKTAFYHLAVINQIMEDIFLDDKRLLEYLFADPQLRQEISKQAQVAFNHGKSLSQGCLKDLNIKELKQKFLNFKVENNVLATLMGIK